MTEEKKKDTPHIFIHKRVRNDDHCPICRVYFVSFHKSWEDAYNTGVNKIKSQEGWLSEETVNEALDDLKKDSCCWIDEWVRRSNGDLYQIKSIAPDKVEYDLMEINCRENKEKECKYMTLHIEVDKKEYCPDNIKFSVTFHKSIEDVHEQKFNSVLYKYGCEENYGKILKITKFPKVGSSMWISENDSIGHHIQIIEIKYDKEIELNSLCSQIDVKNW